MSLAMAGAPGVSFAAPPARKKLASKPVAAESESAVESDGAEEAVAVEKEYKKAPRQVSSTEDYGLHAPPFMAPWMFVPSYLEVNYRILAVCLLREPMLWPGRCEVPSPYPAEVHQRTYELFMSGKRPF